MNPLENLKETVNAAAFIDNVKVAQLGVDEEVFKERATLIACIAQHVDEKIEQLQLPKILQSAFISHVVKHIDEIIKHPKIPKVSHTSEEIESLIASITTIVFGEQRDDSQLQFQASQFLMIQNEKIYLIGQKLGKGGYGNVYLLSPARALAEDNEDVVMKLAKFNENDRKKHTEAVIAIENEFQILSKIHAQGEVVGIQARPIKIVNIAAQVIGGKYYGYLGKKYDGDYSQEMNSPISLAERLQDFLQILSGLAYIHSKNIVHSDVKPNNVFRKQTLNGKLVHLSDFGLARDLSINANLLSIKTPNASKICIDDLLAFSELIRKRPCKKEEIIFLEKQRDIFAMGLVFYRALNENEIPYPLSSQISPLTDQADLYPNLTVYREMNPNVPQEIQAIIKSMLNRDYTKRPSASIVIEMLQG